MTKFLIFLSLWGLWDLIGLEINTHTVAPCAASSTLCLWLKQQRSWPLEMPTVPAHLSNSKSLSNSTCELLLNTPCPPVRPEGGADQTLKRPTAEPSVLLLGPGPGGHAWPLNPHFSDHRPDPGVWGRGWRWAKPVKWTRRSHQCCCCQTPPLKRRTTSQGGLCVDAQSRLQWSKPAPTAGLLPLNTTARRGGDEKREGREGDDKEGYSQNEGGGE